jgi:peptidyl-prolyl cis-trans isomerase A (cyclophilin A)/peptidyl-prolyl cis-trans isomerase B (cyclophilin B)
MRAGRFTATLALLLSLGTVPHATADEAHPQVVLHTSRGAITLALYPDKAPLAVANFLEYAHSGFYEGTIFHRVQPRFVIQGGGFTADMVEKPVRDPIPSEAHNGLHNERWSVAMARTEDPDSATSQFFINLHMNFELDQRGDRPGYTVFGTVTDGQYVVRDISLVKTGHRHGHADAPLEPVLIERVEVLP